MLRTNDPGVQVEVELGQTLLDAERQADRSFRGRPHTRWASTRVYLGGVPGVVCS